MGERQVEDVGRDGVRLNLPFGARAEHYYSADESALTTGVLRDAFCGYGDASPVRPKAGPA
jgi:hypothetical protein